jgi:hypothetical protein
MKENCCEINFSCYDNADCVYATKKPNSKCKYFMEYDYNDFICCSKVAQVNRLVLELQEMTGQKVEIN